MEIEKKFRIKELPDLSSYPHQVMEQGYLCASPTVRVRKCDSDYILTLKDKQGVGALEESGAGIVCREIEIPLSEEAYEHLKKKTDGYLVEKLRYRIPLSDGLTAELDVFQGRLFGLCFVEVEFPDAETARKFVPPDWMGEEVSRDVRFRNTFLSGLEKYQEEIFA